MRWIRLLLAMYLAKHRSKLTLTEDSKTSFRVWLTDVDATIMNHAAMITVMESGRMDFMVRSGFFKLAIKNKWYFPLKNISVEFFRPLKLFQKAELITKVLYGDEKWIYIEQRIVRHGKTVAIGISKNTVRKGKEILSPIELAKALNLGDFPCHRKQTIDSYEKANNLVFEQLNKIYD